MILPVCDVEGHVIGEITIDDPMYMRTLSKGPMYISPEIDHQDGVLRAVRLNPIEARQA